MVEAIIAPYGSWKSPITADLIVGGSVGLSQPLIDGDDVYWIEMRPSEKGRSVIVRCDQNGAITDITPAGFNARTRVHEYGGGDYTVADGHVYFSNFTDQNLCVQRQGSKPEPVTAETEMRYADMVIDKARSRLICVREDHSRDTREAVNELVGIDLTTKETTLLVAGNDFYSSPQLNATGDRLAWLTWNHPNMPWDGSELWVARIEADGSLVEQHKVAGGQQESIFHPQWSPGGALYFVSDRNGWWNLYRLNMERDRSAHNGSAARIEETNVEIVVDRKADFGMPQWGFGMSTYGFASAEDIVCAYVEKGIWNLGIVNTTTRELSRVDSPYTDISYVRASAGRAVMRAGSPSQPASVVRFDLKAQQFEILRRANNIQVQSGYLSQPETVEFPTEEGLTAYGFFYRPANALYQASQEEQAPLLVLSHGGPTAASTTVKNLVIQYWTSRGIGVLDVNYGGSTGFGREYRNRLKDKWGIVDVDDCVNGARYLVARGDADEDRLMISGGSAGGYTTLCALTFRNVFKAGASHYGVSDLAALEEDTHKFESRYSNGLIGPYPEARQIYHDRSPINFVDRLSCPVIFFQGLEDKVVPPNQAEKMVAALQKKGIPVAYVAFAGEQHGFRQAQNIKRAMDGEFYFYSQVFGFEPADELEPVEIQNLEVVKGASD